MIPIRISNKSYKIKSIPELTTAEFIELSKIEACDLVKYISWQTGLSLDTCFFAVTDKRIERALGVAPDITKLPKPKWPDYKALIETVGQRHQIETSNLTGMELLIYCLAVSQAHSNNSDEVQALYDDYLTRPFALILPAGFFFFRNYSNGNRFAGQSLKKLLFSILTAIRKKVQALKNLIRIPVT
jgi:hypothetical protein